MSTGLQRRLGIFCFRHYRLTFVVTALLVVSSLFLAHRFLQLDTNWLVLFRPERPEISTLRYWRDHLPGSKDVAILISDGELDERQMAARRLGEAFRAHPEELESPLDAISTDIFTKSGLFFLAPSKLEELEKQSKLAIEGTRMLELTSPPDVRDTVERMHTDREGSILLAQGLDAFVKATSPDPKQVGSSPIPELEPESRELIRYLGDFPDVPKEAFLTLDGGDTILVLVRPRIGNKPLEAAAPAVAQVRAILEEVRQEFRNLEFSLTGEPVLVVDERKTIADDSIRGTVCSFILVLVLFRFGFREFLRPALALSSLIVGLLWTLGVVSVGIGNLNFITITYVPILVGIGLDFGIHMAFRYYEHRCDSCPEESVRMALDGAGRDTFCGALTTSAAFAVLVVIGFRGVAELGLIALVGVMLCQLSACTFLPACLAWLEQRGARLPDCGRQEMSDVETSLCQFDRPILVGTLISIFLALSFAPFVNFNVHLLKMQSPELESVQTELQLVSEGKSSVLTALIPASSLEEARELEGKIRQLRSVGNVISLATFLPRVTPEKRQSVESIVARKQNLLELADFVTRTNAVETEDALVIVELFHRLDLPPEQFAEVQAQLAELELRLQERGPGPVMDALERIRVETIQRMSLFVPLLSSQVAEPLTAQDLPDTLTGRLLRTDDAYVLKVFPKVDIWRPENLHTFLSELRQVSPAVSGEPVLIELFERLVMRTHWWGMLFSLVAIMAVLWGILRSFQDVLLAAAPTALSLLLVIGLMGCFGWEFNPANFVAVPMLLGIGSVFGLHSMLRIRELGHEKLLSCSTGPAIVLSAATSMAGFASLGLADHRGIASLGWLVTTGLLVNAILSISVLPAWIRMRRRRRRSGLSK